jgi:hypothetical protein
VPFPAGAGGASGCAPSSGNAALPGLNRCSTVTAPAGVIRYTLPSWSLAKFALLP